MSQPEEIAKADPLDADPSLVGAPLNVRKASAWLAAQAKSPDAWKLKVLGVTPIVTLFTGFLGAAIAGDVFHSQAGAGAFFIGGWVGAIVSGVYAWRRHKPMEYANLLVLHYRQLQALGPPADLDVDPAAATPLDQMVARIESLAGDDRAPVRDAARKAATHARRLQSELAHLAKMATGQPDADAALDGARERLQTELARTQARVAELYASLVDLQSGGPVDELRLATERIAAELEVDAKLASARRNAGKQRA